MIEKPTEEITLKPFDTLALYERINVIDLTAGEITILIPITVGRLRDTERSIRFFSTVTISVNGRPQPLGFEIEGAASLEEAINRWPDEAKKIAEKAQEQIKNAHIRSQLQVPAGARIPTH